MSAEYILALLEGQGPPGPPPTEHPYAEVSELLQNAEISERPRALERWVAQADSDGEAVMTALVALRANREGDSDDQAPGLGRLWTLDDLLLENFGELPVLVGDPGNAVIVCGEGHLIAGPPGVGKTLLVSDLSLRVSNGLEVLGFPTVRPLTVLVFQAELPIRFFQYRLNRMTQGYMYDYGRAFDRETRQRVYVQELNQPIDLTQQENLDSIVERVQQVSPDVVVFDPFLSFFRGDENSNAQVRAFLDSLQFQIARGCDCALVITDHLPKSEQREGARARGAGAKIDWASLVINLSRHTAPEGQRDRFIKAELTKVRYGWEPQEPIILRLDSHSLRHTIWNPEDDPAFEQIREIIAGEGGGEVHSQRRMLELIRDRLSVGGRIARGILGSAVERGVVETRTGRNNAIIYRAPRQPEQDSGPRVDENR